MRSCDVLIVGGGPAGSSCAWALRDSGLDVVILDKATFPRNKICGGWITPFVVKALDIDTTEYAQGRTLQPITGFTVSAMGQPEVPVEYSEPVSYGIRRCEFDEYLLRRSDAEVHEGEAFKSAQRNGSGWVVNDKFHAGLLVGAGGHFCPVVHWMGQRNGENPVVAQEIEFEMDERQAAGCKIRPESPELYFCSDALGYGWVFRKDNYLNVGLGRLDQHKLSQHVSGLADFLRRSGKIAFDLPGRFAGHAYLLLGYSRRKIIADGVMLIGDSAGLAYPQSGEGIRPAVESGLIAAEVIQSANKKYSQQRLESYPKLLEQRLGGTTGLSVAKYLPQAFKSFCARQLLKTERFCRNVVIEDWFLRSGS